MEHGRTTENTAAQTRSAQARSLIDGPRSLIDGSRSLNKDAVDFSSGHDRRGSKDVGDCSDISSGWNSLSLRPPMVRASSLSARSCVLCSGLPELPPLFWFLLHLSCFLCFSSVLLELLFLDLLEARVYNSQASDKASSPTNTLIAERNTRSLYGRASRLPLGAIPKTRGDHATCNWQQH